MREANHSRATPWRRPMIMVAAVGALAIVFSTIAVDPADARGRGDRILRGALVGAVIGGIVDGRRGARRGAVIGGVIGAVRRGKRRKYRRPYYRDDVYRRRHFRYR